MATTRTPRARKPKDDGTPPVPKEQRVVNDNSGALTRPVAPWPQVDRYPTILGSQLTIKYIASVWRLALQGYRQQFVDVLDELLDRDPGTYSVLSQRVLTGAIGRVVLTPAKTEPETPDEERAKAICKLVQDRLDAIPNFEEARAQLLWGIYPGISGQEIDWDHRAAAPGDEGWWVKSLSFIHSRRIAYPDWSEFEPHIWDQGMVSGWSYSPTGSIYPTQGVFGIRVKDYPGKFIIHNATLRGDYPTRGGIGRTIGWYMAMKLMAVRAAGDYVERFAKPWAIAYYSTKIADNGGNPRPADEADIAQAQKVLNAVGIGSLNSGVLPDNIKVELDGPGVKNAGGGIDPEKMIKVCDNQINRAVSGGTLSNDGAETGARSLGEVHERNAVKASVFDAHSLADTLQRDLVAWIVKLNCPGEEHLTPTLAIHVEKTDAAALLKRAAEFAAMGGRPDAKWVAEQIGIQQVNPKDEDAQALVPVKPVDFFSLYANNANTVAEALEGLANMVGVSLPPHAKSALAAMPPEDAARFIEQVLAQATADQAKPTVQAGAQPPPGTKPSGNDSPADAPVQQDNPEAEQD